MANEENRDRWLIDGDCSLCRREKYCNKPCKKQQIRHQQQVAAITAQALVNVMTRHITRR